MGVGPEYEADLVDLLPNVRYRYPSGVVLNGSDAVADGSIVEVSKGTGYVVRGDSASRETDFDDPATMWKTIWWTYRSTT